MAGGRIFHGFCWLGWIWYLRSLRCPSSCPTVKFTLFVSNSQIQQQSTGKSAKRLSLCQTLPRSGKGQGKAIFTCHRRNNFQVGKLDTIIDLPCLAWTLFPVDTSNAYWSRILRNLYRTGYICSLSMENLSSRIFLPSWQTIISFLTSSTFFLYRLYSWYSQRF